MNDAVWSPSPEQVADANVTRLMRRLGCGNFQELHRLSVEEPSLEAIYTRYFQTHAGERHAA